MSDSQPLLLPLPARPARSDEQMLVAAQGFNSLVQQRRTLRDFAATPVPLAVMQACIAAAGSAPSGANLQPWHFVLIGDPAVKSRIRAAAEAEEQEFYSRRAPAAWLEALAPLGTDAAKPFLETAPWLVAVFQQKYGHTASGQKVKHYYPTESVGLATGILITALHQAGLATLTHTPSPMGFLNSILDRPESEKPFLLLVVGHPAADAKVPDIQRKPLAEIMTLR